MKKQQLLTIPIPCPRGNCHYESLMQLNDIAGGDPKDQAYYIKQYIKSAIRKLTSEHEQGKHAVEPICQHTCACHCCHPSPHDCNPRYVI